jgi:hypothetical protein
MISPTAESFEKPDGAVDAVSLAKRVENIDITVAGDEAKWNDAKSAVLREIADSPTHDLSA